MSDYEYIIVGDTDGYEDCLVYICYTKENAEKVPERMLSNPTDNDKRLIERHTNLRIKEVPRESCWWRDGCD